jgi:hypothetical protein
MVLTLPPELPQRRQGEYHHWRRSWRQQLVPAR